MGGGERGLLQTNDLLGSPEAKSHKTQKMIGFIGFANLIIGFEKAWKTLKSIEKACKSIERAWKKH